MLRAGAACALLTALTASRSHAEDWTTFGHDPARSNWASGEKTLSPNNVSGLQLQWKTHVNNQYYSLSALTSPVVVQRKQPNGMPRSVVYVAGIRGTVFALDAATGTVIWSKPLRTMSVPAKGGFQGTFLCPNGITATPVIDPDSNNLYVIAADGALYGLDLDTGKTQYGPVPFVAPFAKSWSLNLLQGHIYTTVSLGCGNGRTGVYSADVRSPQHSEIRELMLSKAFTAGIWGRGGPVISPTGRIYGGTADGDTNAAAGDYSNTVVSVSTDDLTVKDYFLPRDYEYIKKNDMDVGSASPVWFQWKNRHLLAHGFKQGVLYLFDADKLGGSDHQTPLFASPRLGNDREECCASSGIWGALAAARDDEENTWLYVPLGGPPSTQAPKFPINNGDNPHGSIMSFKVVEDPATRNPRLEPAWISSDFWYPDPPVVANGVLFALSNGENPDQRGDESRRFLNTRPAVLKALDAKTGKELYNSGSAISTWVHFSALAVSDGHVFAVDHDSNVYCFGLGQGAVSPAVSSKTTSTARTQDEMSSSWIGRAQRQDEFLRSWLIRAFGAAALVILASLAGVFFALKGDFTPAITKD